MQSLSESEQRELVPHLESMQHIESLKSYNNLVFRCFTQCVSTFRSRTLDNAETKCLQNCTDKYLKVTGRVGQRFQEYQSAPPPAAGGK